MAKLLCLFSVLALVVAMATVGTQGEEGCDNDLRNLVSECKQYMMFPANPKIPPSDGCCGAIQKANVPCLCSKVTKEIEKVVCMEKIVYVADYCKKPLQPGSNCGSYTVPN
ncbi:uncharacterized protein LOC133910129 [Phragmites australis]|uniref:uncharacterized protein LOC133910129 n=1 Tax=Phragmites australis TaxID=29695 RepID=UPI002D7950BA|nr:uncharacterized protein LOC133910129 [Phragmites australis]